METTDCDLGWSASIGAAPRGGFDYLVSSVARGDVGIVLAREVTRLSRTDKDWCQLLEVCQVFGTLIGDEQAVYDLVQEAFFVVKYADGPWEINLKKLPGVNP